MSRKPDPRPGRTRARLFAALLELVAEKRWERITVQDILERAGVGRSTFYAHFDNKFDLLTAEIPSLTTPISQADGRPDMLPLFEHVQEMQPVMRPLMTQPLLGEILDTFHRRLADSWRTHLATLDIDQERRDLVAELLAGGFLATARHWLEQGCTRDAATMCREFSSYLDAILVTAQTRAQPRIATETR